MAARKDLKLGGKHIAPGVRATVDLPLTDLSTHTPLSLPVHVIRGRRAGPRIFVCAAIHGDEVNGIEIIRRLLRLPALAQLRGTLLAVPVVNVFGFIAHSRYLPDRRDLNRVFPGSATGSLAARLADLFMREIVAGSDLGIDLHTGAIHRENFPQLRVNLDDPWIKRMASSFASPVIINAATRRGSLRYAAAALSVPVLVFEGAEALRYDERAIQVGFKGIVRVLRALEMIPPLTKGRRPSLGRRPIVARSTTWVRAPCSGVMRRIADLGTVASKGTCLAIIADPFGEREVEVVAQQKGVIIGLSNLPVVHEGDALFHIARHEGTKASARSLDTFEIEADTPLHDTPAKDRKVRATKSRNGT